MVQKLVHITPIRGVNDEGKGKKHALHRLIHAVEADVLWLHDDDVVLPAATDEETIAAMGDADLLILPLRMQPTSDTLLQRLQVIEYTALQQLTMKTAYAGRAVMCSGANLLVRRDVWLKAESSIHPEIASGDDMFLLEYCKRAGLRVRACDAMRLTATITAQPTLRALMRQRMRWAGKAPYYTDKDIRRYGALTAFAMLLQILCPPVVLLYLPWECALLAPPHPVSGNTQSVTDMPYASNNVYRWWDVLLLALIYPYYVLCAVLGGLLHPKRW